MWKTFYAISLALPRIMFRPWSEFQVVVPKSGKPFVQVPAIQTTTLSQKEEAIERSEPLLDQVSRLSAEMTTVRSSVKELMSILDSALEERSDVLSEIIRTSKTYDIDLVEFIKLQDLENTFREKEASQKTVLKNREGEIKNGKEDRRNRG